MKINKDQLAQKIIVDAIIFERMHNGLQIMKAAFEPSGTWNENEPITQYNGTGLVVSLLLQEDNRDLEDEIYNIFDKHLAADTIKPLEERETAGVLSKRIIAEILLKLKYTEANKKEVVS
ncbi:hypothetical protein [uncultured Salegentibacter sp.]|uniref:hypothetical protein n=1 Tax=uncultured Salegentibacter sp. TaxID=259320 RepID=UPI00259773B7|nr:hypothetical protein [uncultured Salegentibacter sp.]